MWEVVVVGGVGGETWRSGSVGDGKSRKIGKGQAGWCGKCGK